MAKMSKKAEMGMGTLIIFIAMILVAAIAAAVLISTTSSLQSKALETGSATRQEVGTSLSVIEITAEDGSVGESVDNFTVLLRLAAGSDPIRFEDTLLSFNLNDDSRDYRYNDDAECGNVSGTDFAVEYAINGTDHRDGYLVPGDVSQVCFAAPRAVSEGEKFRLTLTPRVGAPANVETTLPGLLITQRVKVFP
ncbi:MAG: archaellin/type IV pilin N-terminal domain-containing protein [Candidatus Woesearchaeota archaeon]